MLPSRIQLPLQMLPQPDETTCGPTCLHALYRYWGQHEELQSVIKRTGKLERGGTVAVFLACDALRHGFEATIYTYNLLLFDPSWFVAGVDISERLQRQRIEKLQDLRVQEVTGGYIEFLRLGGRLRLTDLSRYLLRGLLRRRLPIITGLSSTYLYRTMREYGQQDEPDDVRGTPGGHFVVLAGYDRPARTVLVADPYGPHPYGESREYWLNIDRAVGAILLGIVTHDANLLVIHPPRRKVS
ncbi:MAG: hypothetical protein H6R07_2016 [Proteobacteria bacterium]|nr:hypothetical protein [Pseudomonadota bacterium]